MSVATTPVFQHTKQIRATASAPEPPKAKPVSEDNSEEVLARFEANEKAIDVLCNTERALNREIAGITDSPDGGTIADLDRLAGLEAQQKLVPAKIGLLRRRSNSIRRELASAFGCRWFRVSQLAHEVAREREVRMVSQLEKLYCGDRGAATTAAREHPSVARAIERVEVELHVIDRIDPVIGLGQLLRLEQEVLADARSLAK